MDYAFHTLARGPIVESRAVSKAVVALRGANRNQRICIRGGAKNVTPFSLVHTRRRTS